MKYPNITEGRFLSRPNRFIATVTVDGIDQTVHVKNTGRCRELLLPQCKVWLTMPDSHGRKTKYDLVAVEKQRDEKMPLIINMDSQIPNGVVCEWLPKSGLFSSNAVIRREVTHGNSRFDVYVEDGERKAFIEVKGVTLEDKGIAMFPDAPTERGIKHLKVVYSKETPVRPLEDPAISRRQHCICPPGTRKCTVRRDIPGSTAFVPAAAGLIIAGEVVKDLCSEYFKK